MTKYDFFVLSATSRLLQKVTLCNDSLAGNLTLQQKIPLNRPRNTEEGYITIT